MKKSTFLHLFNDKFKVKDGIVDVHDDEIIQPKSEGISYE